MRIRSLLFILLSAIGLAGCRSARSTADLPAVAGFELDRYLGKWHEVARLPHRFEEGMTGVTAEYSRLPDGRVRVINRGVRDGEVREISGIAKFKGSSDTGELRVSFFRPFYADYRIIGLDPEYRWAMVTGSSRAYFWILSRTPELPGEQLQPLLKQAEAYGFPTGELILADGN